MRQVQVLHQLCHKSSSDQEGAAWLEARGQVPQATYSRAARGATAGPNTRARGRCWKLSPQSLLQKAAGAAPLCGPARVRQVSRERPTSQQKHTEGQGVLSGTNDIYLGTSKVGDQ